jgi:hypothetical protein
MAIVAFDDASQLSKSPLIITDLFNSFYSSGEPRLIHSSFSAIMLPSPPPSVYPKSTLAIIISGSETFLGN